jgi:4-amino-4-deoxy-L-arabinose transferase-like glycosyltransferase
MLEDRIAGTAQPQGLARRVLTAILLAGALAAVLQRVHPELFGGRPLAVFDAPTWSLDSGEALIHGIPMRRLTVSWTMPFYSMPDAWLRYQAPPIIRAQATAWAFCACAVLVLALGALLHSAACGGLAVLFLAWSITPYDFFSDRWLFALILTGLAFVSVWRAQAPSLWRSLALGAAVGASLLTLSTMFLFPFLMLASHWRRGDWRSSKAERLEAAALCLVPLLFLVPWVLMNWRVHHRLIIFEDGRADSNLIGGALGMVRSVVAGTFSYKAAGISGEQSVLLWAAGQILTHPLRYLLSCAERLWYIVSCYPVLLLLSASAAWLLRRRKGFAALALLAAYFIGVHCLMSVEERYIRPLLPALSVMAACALVSRIKPSPLSSAGSWSAAIVAAFLAPLLILEARTLALVTAYPGREPGMLAIALSRTQADAWLWAEQGGELLRGGRIPEASAACAEAHRLDPESRSAPCILALSLPAGRPVSASDDLPPSSDRQVLALLLSLRRGDRAETARSAASLVTTTADDGAMMICGEAGRRGSTRLTPTYTQDCKMEKGLGLDAERLTFAIRDILAYWPGSERLELLRRLKAWLDVDPGLAAKVQKERLVDLSLEQAEAAAAAGQRRLAFDGLKAARLWPLDPLRLARAAALEDELGRKQKRGTDGDGSTGRD